MLNYLKENLGESYQELIFIVLISFFTATTSGAETNI